MTTNNKIKRIYKKVSDIYSVDMLDKEMIHVPVRIEQDGMRIHHATWNSTQFKT